MPRGGRIVRPQASSGSESDEDSADTTQSRSKNDSQWSGSQSQGRASTSFSQMALSEDDKDKMTSDLVFLILAQEAKRAPIKRANMMKLLNIQGRKNLQEEIWNAAVMKLTFVFGLEVKESEEKKSVYYLLNRMTEDATQMDNHHLTWSESENAHLGLLWTVLGLIFMSNDVVKEDTLFKFLKQLGVYEEPEAGHRATQAETPDTLFGDVRKLVFEEWGKRQGYLEITKIDTGNVDQDQTVYEIRWGPRAKAEVKKSQMLMIVANLYECAPKDFKQQFSKIVQEEGENAFNEVN